MKGIIGIILIVLGIILGIYVGVWFCFIGGIIQVLDAIKITPIPSMPIAIGIFRIIGAGFCGFFSAIALIIPGITMIALCLKK
jgi:hypothetical protein